MKTYTILQLAKMFSVNQETVRRWCRSGELKSILLSNKGGRMIGEYDLRDFLIRHPKYREKYKVEHHDPIAEYKAVRERLKNELDELELQKLAIEKRIAEIQELLK